MQWADILKFAHLSCKRSGVGNKVGLEYQKKIFSPWSYPDAAAAGAAADAAAWAAASAACILSCTYTGVRSLQGNLGRSTTTSKLIIVLKIRLKWNENEIDTDAAAAGAAAAAASRETTVKTVVKPGAAAEQQQKQQQQQ